jgi:hypothetical protein
MTMGPSCALLTALDPGQCPQEGPSRFVVSRWPSTNQVLCAKEKDKFIKQGLHCLLYQWKLKSISFEESSPFLGLCRTMCCVPQIPKCCKGFYGPDCNPCPGGFSNPCSGNGQVRRTVPDAHCFISQVTQ